MLVLIIVTYFTLLKFLGFNFNLWSCEFDNFTFTLWYWESFYINIILKANKFAIVSLQYSYSSFWKISEKFKIIYFGSPITKNINLSHAWSRFPVKLIAL